MGYPPLANLGGFKRQAPRWQTSRTRARASTRGQSFSELAAGLLRLESLEELSPARSSDGPLWVRNPGAGLSFWCMPDRCLACQHVADAVRTIVTVLLCQCHKSRCM
jgi:hypothetical protein